MEISIKDITALELYEYNNDTGRHQINKLKGKNKRRK